MRKVYRVTSLLPRKTNRCNLKPTKDKSGNLLTTAETQVGRWHEYYTDQLSPHISDHSTESATIYKTVSRNINEATPTADEIKIAVKSMRDNKSAGFDDLPAE